GTVATAGGNEDVETGPHVSFEDTPFGHDTHDMTFKVRPDDGYQYLLGLKQFNGSADGGACSTNAPEVCVPECPLEPPPTGLCLPPCIVDIDGNCNEPDGSQCLVCPSDCETLPDGRCTKTPGGASCTNLSCDVLQQTSGCGPFVVPQDVLEVEWESG